MPSLLTTEVWHGSCSLYVSANILCICFLATWCIHVRVTHRYSPAISILCDKICTKFLEPFPFFCCNGTFYILASFRMWSYCHVDSLSLNIPELLFAVAAWLPLLQNAEQRMCCLEVRQVAWSHVCVPLVRNELQRNSFRFFSLHDSSEPWSKPQLLLAPSEHAGVPLEQNWKYVLLGKRKHHGLDWSRGHWGDGRDLGSSASILCCPWFCGTRPLSTRKPVYHGWDSQLNEWAPAT